MSQYKSVYENCFDAILLTSPSGQVLAANPAACRMFGRTEAEVCTAGRAGLMDLSDPMLEIALEIRRKTGEFSGVLRFKRKDGTVFSGEVTSKVYLDDDSQMRSVIIIRDINDRIIVQSQLHLSELRYQSVLDNMLEGCQIISPEWEYLYLNDAAIAQSHLDRHQLMGHSMLKLYPGIEKTSMFHQLEMAMKNRLSSHIESQFNYPDGQKGYFELYVEPVTEGLFILSLDITERKQAEQKLKQTLDTLKLFVEHAPAAIAMFNRKMEYIAYSRRFVTDYGLSDESLIGRSHYDVFPELPQSYKDIHQRCLNGAVEKSAAEPFERLSGKTDWVSWEIHPWYERRGRIGGIILFSEVVTEQVRAADEHHKTEERLVSSLKNIIEVISRAIELRDPYTAGHQIRVKQLAVAIAADLGLAQKEIESIALAAIVHDVGKLHIPADFLSKPGKLTDLEYSIIKTHSQYGFDILKDVEFPWPIAQMVLQHHERIDGSGYPNHLKGDQLLLGAKILMVSDVVEAIASHRPYRAALGIDQALSEIREQSGKKYDSEVVDSCLRLFEQGFTFIEIE